MRYLIVRMQMSRHCAVSGAFFLQRWPTCLRVFYLISPTCIQMSAGRIVRFFPILRRNIRVPLSPWCRSDSVLFMPISPPNASMPMMCQTSRCPRVKRLRRSFFPAVKSHRCTRGLKLAPSKLRWRRRCAMPLHCTDIALLRPERASANRLHTFCLRQRRQNATISPLASPQNRTT